MTRFSRSGLVAGAAALTLVLSACGGNGDGDGGGAAEGGEPIPIDRKSVV